MTNVISKLAPIECTCKEFIHPWSDSCMDAIAGLLINAMQHSFRIYSVVYALSLIMRHRIPTIKDLKRTLLGVLQSTAFLTTNGFSFMMFFCAIHKAVGKMYFPNSAFVPAFLASLMSIFIERPVRRPLLALYVSNLATESVWKMLESRNYVKSIPNGQAIIFGVSVSIMLYIYRLGMHKNVAKDSLFDILRLFVGRSEEGPVKIPEEPFVVIDGDERIEPVSLGEPQPSTSQQRPSTSRHLNTTSRPLNNYRKISRIVQLYFQLIDRLRAKHDSCPHKGSCISYTLMGGLKPLIGGIGLQVVLKTILSLNKIIQNKMQWRKTIFNKNTLKLGIFLGGFSFLYKSVSCALRHLTDKDDPLYAIPAGLVGSIAFTKYPDVTVALYILWKMLQITYNIGIDKGIVPNVPGFIVFLYCTSTATLFHSAIVEPNNIRHSYYKFLHTLSGAGVSHFDRSIIDVWGLDSSKKLYEVMKKTGTLGKPVKFFLS